MKRLTLLKTLATLGACSLIGVSAAETTLLLGNKTNNNSDTPVPNNLINLNNFDG
jgi:hypothetical protein